jgi:hypothetical protein
MQAAALCPQCAPPAVRSRSVAFPIDLERQFDSLVRWDLHDPDLGRPIAAPLARCAELLGVDLATICEAAANVEPYIRADGIRIWSLMQLERLLRPEAYGRRRGGYLDRRRTRQQHLQLSIGPTGMTSTSRNRSDLHQRSTTP